MKLLRMAGLALTLPLCTAAAEDYPEFVEWMKGTDAATAALRKLDKKVGPQAAAAGERMASVYENMVGFWRQLNAADAAKLSEEGKTAALMLMNAASAGDADKAAAAFNSLNGTCRSCHDSHRERVAQGKYRIK